MACLSSWPAEDWKVPIVHYFAGHIQFSRRVAQFNLLSQFSFPDNFVLLAVFPFSLPFIPLS